MMLATLIIYACVADLSACRRERLSVSGGYATAQQAVAEWVGEHPGYAVLSWRFSR